MNTITYEEAIEKVGFGRFQRKLMIICGMGWAADAMEVLLVAFVIPVVAKEWGLSTGQRSLLATAIFLGMLVGAWGWGWFSDRVGRRWGFMATVGIDSIFGFLSAFSPSFIWLLVLRALTGVGVGGTLPVDYSIFTEYLPAHKRGRYLVLLEAFWALGSIAAAGLAWLLVPSLGWRWLLAVSAIPGIIIFFVRRYIPESPRYLLVSGKPAEARAVLEMVARENGTILPEGELRVPPPAPRARVKDLWAPKLRRTTIMLWLIWFAISLGYYGVNTWLPSYFNAKGMALASVYQNAFIMALAQLPGYFSAAYLVEKVGRRRTLAFYLVASGIFTYLFALATSLPLVIGMAIWMSFFTLGAWGALYAYTPEAYPTTLRATGMGAASGMTRIAGALAPFIVALVAGGSLGVALTLYAVSFVIGGLGALGLPVETNEQPLADTLAEAAAPGD